MANILYGVNGEGSGHSTRAQEVLRHLIRQGHSVHVASFDRGLANLKDEFEVTEIYGLRLSYVNNRVRYHKTVAKNLLSAPKAVKSNHQLMRLAKQWNIDLVITDFEPMTTRVAHRKRLPLIAIDNQHCITNAEVSYPKQHRRDAAATKLVARLMTPRANAYLVLSFFPAKIKKKNTYLFSPLLRKEVLSADPKVGDYVLVYVTSPSPKLSDMLKRVRCRFVAYGFGREAVDGNIRFKKPSQGGFLADLAQCKAVIANSGFSLISEALHLGKPYLAIPVAHQFEQIFNAHYLDKLGYGAFWEDLEKEKIESCLFYLDVYRQNLDRYPRQDNAALLAKLDSLILGFTTPQARAAGR
jgi:uncharacterized protein (TIGR00661 family)